MAWRHISTGLPALPTDQTGIGNVTQLVNSTVLKGTRRCTLFALCNVPCGSPELLSRSRPWFVHHGGHLADPSPIWAGSSHLIFLLTAPNLPVVSSHHPCSFRLCSIFHAQHEADLLMSSACWIMAFRKLNTGGVPNTNLEETPPLHQVLVSDLRASWSWSLVASPSTLKAKVLSICKGSLYTPRGLAWTVHTQVSYQNQSRAFSLKIVTCLPLVPKGSPLVSFFMAPPHSP